MWFRGFYFGRWHRSVRPTTIADWSGWKRSNIVKVTLTCAITKGSRLCLRWYSARHCLYTLHCSLVLKYDPFSDFLNDPFCCCCCVRATLAPLIPDAFSLTQNHLHTLRAILTALFSPLEIFANIQSLQKPQRPIQKLFDGNCNCSP